MTPLAQFKASFASLSLTLKKMFSPSGGNSPCRATLSGGGFIIEFDIPVHLGAPIPIPMPLRSRFDKLVKEAGLPQMRFHDLRHSAATILLSMGGSAKVVQRILRYSDISTTLNIYAHVLPEMHQEAMEKMDTFLRGEK